MTARAAGIHVDEPPLELFDQPQILVVDGSSLPELGAGHFYGIALPPAPASPIDPPLTHGAPITLEQAKAAHVKTVLEALDWNMSEAGRVLEVDRRTLYRMCKRWRLERT